MGVRSAYSPMAAWSFVGTSAMTCSTFPASPATIPAAMAAGMPFFPPVLGTTTLFTFLMIFPEMSASIRSGRAPSSSRSRAAA